MGLADGMAIDQDPAWDTIKRSTLLTDAAKNPTSFGTASARRLGAKSLNDTLQILVEEQKATMAEREALEKTRQETDAKIADCDVRIQAYAASLEILRRKA